MTPQDWLDWAHVMRALSGAPPLPEEYHHWASILRRAQEECWALETAALISAALSSRAPPETIEGDSPT